jgi:transposase
MGMRPNGSARQLEQRRRQAVALLEEGLTTHEVATRLGCTARSVRRWRQTWKGQGPPALDALPRRARPSKVTARQKARLVRCLLRGARANGFVTDLWTTGRVATLLEDQFGVHYHVNSLWKFLTSLGFSSQKPEKRAAERDEARIQRWVKHEWPRIKKTPPAEAPPSPGPTRRGSV